MRNRLFNGLAGICLCLVPAASGAENLALVIANQTYRGQPVLSSGGAAEGLAEDLKARGWSVFSASDASPEEMRNQARKLLAAMQRSPEPDRLIVAVTGLMVENDRDSWLLSDAPGETDMFNIGERGLSIGALADIAAQAPGRAVVLIGLLDEAAELGEGLRPATGDVPAPQGVSVVRGSMAGLRNWSRDSLLSPGNTLDDALGGLPESAAFSGYTSSSGSFAGEEEDGAARPTGEIAYWNAVRDIGTIEALQAYLGRYPAGIFAQEARKRIEDQTPDPLADAREAEQALGLTRNDRRQIQRNLALLGFDPRGIDGLFGRGSRAAIAAWQQASGYEGFGFVTAAQKDELQRQADVRAAKLEREARLRREAEERADRQYWQELGRDEASLQKYLERYPDGLFAEDAQARLDLILEERRAAAEAKEREDWDDAVEKNSVSGYRDFLEKFPNGVFAEEARKRIEELTAEAENAEVIERLQNAEALIVPNKGARLIVERILAARGLKPGPVDGQFTRETRRAIRRFQRENGLAVNGFVTQRTMVVLMLSR